MAWVETRIPRTSQPQDTVGIDWNNPLTKRLKLLYSDGSELVSMSIGTKFSTEKVSTQKGLGLKLTAIPGRVQFSADVAVGLLSEITLLQYGRIELTTVDATAISKSPSNGASTTPFDFGIAGGGGIKLGRANSGFKVWRSSATIQENTDFIAFAVQSSDIGSAPKFYINGLFDTASAISLYGGTGTGTATEGGALRILNRGDGEPFWNGGAIYLCCAWDRQLTSSEIKSLSDNPWQIFEPEIVRIWVDDQVTGGAVTGNASGSLSAVSLSPVSGSASGAASASASLSAVSLTAVNGTASGASVASGVFAPISLSAINATATGSANASATLASISLSPITGTANGETVVAGNASGAFDDVALSPVSGTASGTASATGLLSAISLTPITGTASGEAVVAGNASGSFDDVSLTALTGEASGSSAGVAAGVFASLSINPATGAAYGAAVAVGSLPVIALTPLTGSATGVSIIPAYASGAFDDITLSPLTGTAAVIRMIRPIVPNYNTMSVDASYNVAYIDPTYWID